MSDDFPDYRDSPLLRFESGPTFKGDPQTPEHFAQALAYLEAITTHFMEDGPWWTKTAEDLSYELSYHNGWERQEVGESYRETTLDHLQALSKRRIQAMEETGWHLTHFYRIAVTFDRLIEQALAAEESVERLMTRMTPSHSPTPFSVSTDLSSQILTAITAAFQESDDILEKNHDDLRYELEFQNDCVFEDNPAAAEVTLLQLLHASTSEIKAGLADPAQIHIHELIEYAFLEQEIARAVQALWPETRIPTFASVHIPLLEAAVRDHLSENGLTVLDAFLERARQVVIVTADLPHDPLPDYRDSPFLHFGHDVPILGDPKTEPAFAQTRRFMEGTTARFLETGLGKKIPADLLHALEEYNTRRRSKTGQEDQVGIPKTEYQDITLSNVQALSKRRILAMEEMGWHLTPLYRIAVAFDRLIDQTLVAEASIEQLMSQMTSQGPAL